MNSNNGGITSDNLISIITKQEAFQKRIVDIEKEVVDFRKLLSRGEPKPTVQINPDNNN